MYIVIKNYWYFFVYLHKLKSFIMGLNIKITRVKESRIESVDFDAIPFGKTLSDHMFSADYIDGQWGNFQIIPYGPFSISPANLALNYGQSIFEGMKATKLLDGTAVFMRPQMHAKRFNKSAVRMAMPTIPEEIFIEALDVLVDLDKSWIPKNVGSALYIRPLMYATDERLGVSISDTYKFVIICGPVGPYYPKPIKLYSDTQYVRAVVGGVGEAKTAGNYAASLYPAIEAKKKGYDQIMWLDAKEFKYVQEVGTMNLFFVIDGKVITPDLNGAILAGITRDSIIHVLKEKGYVVEERPLSIDEILEADSNGTLQEVFGSGTAAVIANVIEINIKGKIVKLPPVEEHKIAIGIKGEINGIRNGSIPDVHNWIIPVGEASTVIR